MVALAPGAMLPVFHPVLSLVDVCLTPSVLRHVMVVLARIVIVLGLNELFDMLTVFGVLLPVLDE